MPLDFDATGKYLITNDPLAWLEFVGLPATSARILDVDLSTVTSDADRGILIEAPDVGIGHIELESGHPPRRGAKIARYNSLLYYEYAVPIYSNVILLRKEADHSDLTGLVQYGTGDHYHEFHYRIIRVWEVEVEEILSGGWGILPLAPLAKVSKRKLPSVIRRMEERIEAEVPPELVGPLWTATFVLMGLKYEQDFTQQLLRGVRQMKESVTYQAILQEGRDEGIEIGGVREARNLSRRIGTKRFGPIKPRFAKQLDAIPSLEELEQLGDRLLEVESWIELLKS